MSQFDPKQSSHPTPDQPVFWSPAPSLRKYPGYLFWKLQCQLTKSEFRLLRQNHQNAKTPCCGQNDPD